MFIMDCGHNKAVKLFAALDSTGLDRACQTGPGTAYQGIEKMCQSRPVSWIIGITNGEVIKNPLFLELYGLSKRQTPRGTAEGVCHDLG